MSEWFVGEIRLFPYGVVPKGWAQCKGQLLNVTQNQILFYVIGNQFGGNIANNTFALPNLAGRVIAGTGGQNLPGAIGTVGGSDQVTLTVGQIPAHTHQAIAIQGPGAGAGAKGKFPASAGPSTTAGAPSPPNLFAPRVAGPTVGLNAFAVSGTGANGPHENRQPYLALNYCIALNGLLPPRN